MKVAEEGWLQDTKQYNSLDYVSGFKYILYKACDLAHKNLKEIHKRKLKPAMQEIKKSRERVFNHFNIGDRVLVLLPIPAESLRAKFYGPYIIDRNVSDIDFTVYTPDGRKTMIMCHVNMLKCYHVRDDTKPVLNQNNVTSDTCDETENPGDDFVMNCDGCDIRLENADILSNLETKVSHLEPQQCMYPDGNHVFDGGGCNVHNPCVEMYH